MVHSWNATFSNEKSDFETLDNLLVLRKSNLLLYGTNTRNTFDKK